MEGGALGFWSAPSEVYPESRQQRCWVHKTANVLNYQPRGVQPKAKKVLQEIWMAEDRASAHKAFTDNESNRVDLCDDPSSDRQGQGMREPEYHAGDDLQAGDGR